MTKNRIVINDYLHSFSKKRAASEAEQTTIGDVQNVQDDNLQRDEKNTDDDEKEVVNDTVMVS